MPETHTDKDLSTTATSPGLVLRRREAADPSPPPLREQAQGDRQKTAPVNLIQHSHTVLQCWGMW